MPPLTIAPVPAPGRVVVRVSGEVDVATSAHLDAALAEIAASEVALVIVDVATAEFWDVSGLHVLAGHTERLAASGRQCRIVGAPARTRRLIALADFLHCLQLDGPLPLVPESAERDHDELTPPPPPPTTEAERPAARAGGRGTRLWSAWRRGTRRSPTLAVVTGSRHWR